MTSNLIDRLSKLDGPNRECDAELEAVSLGGRVYLNDPEGKEVIIERPIDGFWIRGIYPYRKISRYTASVDAVIALAERVLPELSPQVGRNVHHKYWHASVCRINDNMADGIEYYDAMHDVAAIALCIAILRAKEAENAE